MARPPSSVLNKAQIAVYLFACEYFRTCNRFPTNREIIDNTPVTSTSVVDWHLGKLVDAGLIEKIGDRPGVSRDYKIVGVSIYLPQPYWSRKRLSPKAPANV